MKRLHKTVVDAPEIQQVPTFEVASARERVRNLRRWLARSNVWADRLAW